MKEWLPGDPIPTSGVVTIACPSCGWISEEEEIDPSEVNGAWFAMQRLAPSYRKHVDNAHWRRFRLFFDDEEDS